MTRVAATHLATQIIDLPRNKVTKSQELGAMDICLDGLVECNNDQPTKMMKHWDFTQYELAEEGSMKLIRCQTCPFAGKSNSWKSTKIAQRIINSWPKAVKLTTKKTSETGDLNTSDAVTYSYF